MGRIKSDKEIAAEMIRFVNVYSKMCLKKVKFSRIEAIQRAAEITRTDTPMFYYECPNCKWFHLTRTPH